jgi:hypothetical protein
MISGACDKLTKLNNVPCCRVRSSEINRLLREQQGVRKRETPYPQKLQVRRRIRRIGSPREGVACASLLSGEPRA